MNKKIKKVILAPLNQLYKFNPKIVIQLIFYLKQRKKLDLDNPRTYNEKLNWMKLNYRNDLMPICADKYTVRQYVEECGCGELLTKMLWHGYDPSKIPFDILPDKFVIKVTHGSGGNIICKNKKQLNISEVIRKLNLKLKEKYIPAYGEWFYGIIEPSIIIEEFLSEDGDEIPLDYKMFCFNNIDGKDGVGFTVVDTDRFTYHKRKVFDNEWNEKNDTIVNFPYDNNTVISKPKVFEKMKMYASKLAKPFPHARVDFYVVNDKLYFGEITFMSDAGYGKITPENFSIKMGEWIDLKKKGGDQNRE